MPNQKSKETLLVEELYDIKMQLREAQDKLWKATAERASWELDAKLRLDLAEADLARVTAERDNYQSDIDRYAWNLAGCDTIASGWGKPGDYNKELALPALDSVSRMAQDLAALRARVAELVAALEAIANGDDAPDIDAVGEWAFGLHCGLEDRMIADRYEAADYGHAIGAKKVTEWATGVARAALARHRANQEVKS